MIPEFAIWVDEAATIATSGRWEAVNARIEYLSANPGLDNAWWVTLFGGLCVQIFSEYLALKRAYENEKQDAPLLAWRARNLLEMSVWCIYCAQSRANARRVYEDKVRDIRDVYEGFIRWGKITAQAADWLDPLTAARDDLSQLALTMAGIESFDGPYKKVNDAADECSLGDHFRLSYKMLSKFAHPTAMRILASTDDQMDAQLREQFFSQGCLFFMGAFHAIETELIPRR